MKNINKLIQLYFYICDCYDRELSAHFQRQSNNFQPKLSDKEILTIFFYCLIVERRKEIKDIYDFTDNYLRSWFPDLGHSYESFLIRINNMNEVFPPLIFYIIEQELIAKGTEKMLFYSQQIFNVVDSMPIILAKGARSFTGKIAPELCNKGYCSSKNLYYYGLKLHVMGLARLQKLPLPEFVGVSPASNNDLTVFKPIFETLHNRAIFADKIYGNVEFEKWLLENNNLEILTPVKKKKGQKKLNLSDSLYSKSVSKIRQPIEAFFSWIIDKTGIQNASKCRSKKGLLTHVFGRFAAAMMMMTFDFL